MAGLYALNDEDDGEFLDDGLEDDEKPVWGDDVDIGDIPMSPSFVASTSKVEKKKKKKKKKGGEDEDEGVDIDAMDADVLPAAGDHDEEWDGTEEMRKRKLDEWMQEVYALDFNDIVSAIRLLPGPPAQEHRSGEYPRDSTTHRSRLKVFRSHLRRYCSPKTQSSTNT
jgi:protein KRI1